MTALPAVDPMDLVRRRPKTVMHAIVNARELITPFACWTSGCFARGPDGSPIVVISHRATCWCAEGAVRAVTGDRCPLVTETLALLNAASRDLFGVVVVGVNDDASVSLEVRHARVLKVFDHAFAYRADVPANKRAA